MGYEAMREQTLARQKKLGLVPKDTELPPINPIGTPETRTGPDGKPFPMMDTTQPWDSLSDDEKRALLPHGRGLRRVPRARRRPDRAAARLPRGVRLAREHARGARVRQRRVGRGRAERLRQRDEVRKRHPRHRRGQPADDGRPRRPEDVQPLPERLGDGLQHAVQDVEALRVQRRHQRPVHHVLAGRHEGPRRDPRPVPPRHRHRPDDPRRARRRAAGGDQGPRPEPVRRRQHALQPRRRQGGDDAADAVLRHARLPGRLARGLEGREHASHDQRLEQLQRRRVGALQHRRRPLGAAQPGRRAPRQGARAREPLVRGGRAPTGRSRSTTARRSRS